MRFCRCFVASLFAFTCALTTNAASVTLVSPADTWSYHKGTNAPQSDWKTVPMAGLDGQVWLTGQGGFGFATDNTAETADCRTLLTDMQNNYRSLYLRRTFTVSSAPAADQHLLLTMDWDDGFIAFLDGNYLTNMYVASAPAEPLNTDVATGNHESSKGNSSPQSATTFDLGLAGSRLAPGEHTLAIVGLNVTLASSDFVMVPTLLLDVPPTPPSNSVPASIVVDTTLYASNSPYAAPGTVTVGNNATLTIEPGTTVYMYGGASLTVSAAGRLLALGTEDEPIRITRPTPTAANWGRININGGPGSPESRMAYVYVEGNGSSPCIEVADGTAYLDHISFGTTSRPYLGLDRASFVVTDCYFPAATASFEPVHGTGGIKAGGRGIIQNCFFGPHSGYADTIDFTGGNRPSPILQVINNVFTGSGDDNLDLDSTDAWVEGNIFMHVHKNGSPDTSSAISGGNDDGNTSGVTVLGNIFYDCDHMALLKQGNLFTFMNNTFVRQTHVGGLDSDGALICLQDNNMTEGRGSHLEGNIFYDIEKLTRDAVTAVITFTNNLMALPWGGPGGDNSSEDPKLAYIPQLSETYFTNWADAQILKQWFKPLPGSPAIGTGPNGADKGGVVPLGATISGEPSGTTTNTSATLQVGLNRRGGLIYPTDWPSGSGFTHYKWRLDDGSWSAETPILTPITLSGLAPGAHHVDVIGKNDAGFYQNDPVFGSNAVVTVSRTWTVQGGHPSFSITSVSRTAEGLVLEFPAVADSTYTVEYRTSLEGASAWSNLTNVPAQSVSGPMQVMDPAPADEARYYRVRTPAAP